MTARKLEHYGLAAAPVADTVSTQVGTGRDLNELSLLQAATREGFHHICQKSGHNFELELKTARAIAKDPGAFLREPLLYAVGGIPTASVQMKFGSSPEKAATLDGMANFLRQEGANRSLTTSVLNCTDEMYTNALYNAPFVDLHSQRNPGVGRDLNSVFLSNQYVVEMSAARLDDRIAIACRDPFGSLDVDAFLNRILRTVEVGPSEAINFGAGGAGLGSYIIFKECSSLYVVAERGVATVVACVFPLGMSGIKRESLDKHLHWQKV